MAHPPTSVRELDAAVETVASRKQEWVAVPIGARIDLLRQCLDGSLRTADAVVRAGCEAKRLDPQSPVAGEEWMSGPIAVIRQLRLFIETLTAVARTGYPELDAKTVHRSATGELAVTVFPQTLVERGMYPGTRIDVWMQPEVDERNLRETMAVAYRGARRDGRVALVLGAGNVASIAPTDVLYELLVENTVVVAKMHPVNDYLGPLLERAFEPLVSAGYLRIVYGEAAEGQHLIHHPGIDEVHMTGSTAVHDRIVWGDTPEEQARRRASRAPKVTKRVTSELGCVTPAIVVPGRWSEAELQYHAEYIATMVVHSASCTCTTARVLVTSKSWPQRQALLDRVAAVLAQQPRRLAYYPGSAEKYERFAAGNGDTHHFRELTAAKMERVPISRCLGPVVLDDIDATADCVAYAEEAWSPVLVETPLDTADDGEFLDAAVRFCNERLFGTLSMGIVISPPSRTRLGAAFDRAVAALRYGTVAINHWSAMSFVLGNAPWGAYPGHTLEDVGSGIGVVHNTLMFDKPLKTVLWGSFTSWPKPAWFVTHRRGHIAGRRMAAFEASPSLFRLPAIAVAGMRP